MIWCRYKVGDKIAYGTLENDVVTEVEGTPFGQHKATKTTHALSAVKLLAPTIPANFFCVGVNYPDHIRKMAAKRNVSAKFPEQPDVGYRSNNAIINPEEDIVKPKDRLTTTSNTKASWSPSLGRPERTSRRRKRSTTS